MPLSLKTLGKRLQYARQITGLTQERVAEIVDISPAHLGKIERGVKCPNLQKLSALCDVINIPMNRLFAEANVPKNVDLDRRFSEIVAGCDPELIEAILDTAARLAKLKDRRPS